MRKDSKVLLGAAVLCTVMVFTIPLSILIAPSGHDAECPPLIEASTKLRLYFDAPPPELTDADREFAELCGVGDWGDPFREAPPEDGGA